jgi:GAF domain-containing protein
MSETPNYPANDPQQIIAELQRKLDERTIERDEAASQQAATADILKVISRSAFDLQLVLDALVESVAKLCDTDRAVLIQKQGDQYYRVALQGFPADAIAKMKGFPVDLKAGSIAARALRNCTAVHVADVNADPEYPGTPAQSLGGVRTVLSVPLIRETLPVGAITVSRTHVEPFTKKQIDLIKTFADQAVIAIENARLFDEVQARTQELTESLQFQTATSDVLKVISRSAFDLKGVFNTLLKSAAKLIGASNGALCVREGEVFPYQAMLESDPEWTGYLQAHPARGGRQSISGRVILSGEVETIADVPKDAEYDHGYWLEGHTSMIGVPLLRSGKLEGVFSLSRPFAGEFTPREIDLIRTFADQAVIAIENTRLFDEVQARTRDLSESLQQQTATGDVLKVIASSPTNVEPALRAIVESACAFCGAYDAAVMLKIGDDLHFSAHHGPIQPGQQPRPINRQWVTGRAVVDKVPVQVSDFQAPEAAEFPEGQRQSREQGMRCTLSVPLLREGEAIGAVVLRRLEPVAFSDKQVALLQTFADQAVIAIGNVRLFEEVQAKTRDLTESLEQQTATSEVLQVISSSPGELEPVFRSMLENATRVCGASFGVMNLWDGETLNTAADYNVPLAFTAWRQRTPIRPQPNSGLASVVNTHQVAHIHDLRTGALYLAGDPTVHGLSDIAGARTIVIVPMLREDELIGTITIFRQEVRPFTEKQISFVENFTKQAVIAIENTRLLSELRERTTELSQSLDDLRTAQDRLVQTEKLASLGQLTAGIAHEIKNPLNFVNNFSALSAELTDELNDVLKPAPLDDKMRQDVDELTGLIKDNLEKVVQHGKRADSIVKNMLLHSRQGSGEHRPVDINAIVEESLNLAYHGARAENTGFNITMHRSFDPAVGMADGYPQEITRALLNLIANGFYAATKRKSDAGDGFEPTLTATTRNLGDKVEIRISDNGTGIPTEVKEKIFNPFFTTKPAGEGTGLGLSMSHDIIVKQHGGTIDVDTVPGAFTEFKIVLPRAGASLIKSGEHP